MSKFTIPENVLYICTGSKCAKRGGKEAYKAAKSFLKHQHHHGSQIDLVRTDCTDRCEFAPVCALQPGNTWLKEYSPKDVLKKLEELTRH